MDNSGCAASGKTISPSPQHDDNPRSAGGEKDGRKRKAQYSAKQRAQVAAVRAFLPPEFLEVLPDVPTLSEAILSAMATDGRTVEQMGQRLLYRWLHHNYAAKFFTGELERPVGAAVGMVRPLRRGDRYACADARCENGADIVTGEECRLCAVRIADWEAARERQRAERQPTGANSAPSDAGPSDTLLPPQRATQAAPEPRTEQDWRAQAAAAQKVLEDSECSGRDNMCGRALAPGQILCRDCADEAAEQRP